MLTLDMLLDRPEAFKSMTGLSLEEFLSLLEQVGLRYLAMVKSRVDRPDRKRAPGGGAKSRYDVADRLFMTLVWLQLYLTCEAMGVLFGARKGTVSRLIRPMLAILRDLGKDTLGWPEDASGSTLSNAELTSPDLPMDPPDAVATSVLSTAGPDQEVSEVTPPDEESTTQPDVPTDSPGVELGCDPSTDEADAAAVVTPDQSGCPDYAAVIDATEQRTERNSVYEVQKRFYSGKRKAHTIKTQIVVNEQGRIRDVSDSVPGSTHDLTLLRQSGLPTRLPLGLTLIFDCGYRGVQVDFPNHSVALPYRPKSGEELTPEEKYHNHLVSRIRVVVENTIAELKHFRILTTVFRHGLELYRDVIQAIVGIVNRHIDNRLARRAVQGSIAA